MKINLPEVQKCFLKNIITVNFNIIQYIIVRTIIVMVLIPQNPCHKSLEILKKRSS